jgi:hypothetical protein
MSDYYRRQGNGLAYHCHAVAGEQYATGNVHLDAPLHAAYPESCYSTSLSLVEKTYEALLGEGSQKGNTRRALLVSDLGWTRQEAHEVRATLTSFEKLWDAPGMEEYDDL